MADKWTADEVVAALRSHYPQGFALLEELPHGGGFIDSRIDVLAIGTWPSHGPAIEAIEIKVSRSDFTREIRSPKKRSGWDGRCTAFYFAAPVGLIRAEEVPPDCGLLEVSADGVTKVVKPPHRPWAPTLSLIQVLAARAEKERRRADDPRRAAEEQSA